MAGTVSSDAAAPSTTAEDVFFLRVSAQLARNCASAATAYDVGCVITAPTPVDGRAVDRDDMLLKACNAAAEPPIAGLAPSATPETLFSRIISWGYSRELPGNTHAEECALLKLGLGAVEQDGKDGKDEHDEQVSAPPTDALGAGAPSGAKSKAAESPDPDAPTTSGAGAHATVESTVPASSHGGGHLAPVATVYTSMEPCSLRLSGRPPCTDRLLACRARRVVVAVPEPPKFVAACEGTVRLRAGGCEVLYGCDECAAEWAREVNAHHAPSVKPPAVGAGAGAGAGPGASGGKGVLKGEGKGKGE